MRGGVLIRQALACCLVSGTVAGCAARTPVPVLAESVNPCRWQATTYTFVDATGTDLDAQLDDQDRRDLLPGMFDAPAISVGPLSTHVASLRSLAEANRRVFVSRDAFANAFDCLTLGPTSTVSTGEGLPSALQVRFTYHGRPLMAHAYGPSSAACDGTGTAALVIPGSGDNQASAALRDAGNYQHGLVRALEGAAATYVLIKPNEDALAWHDGNGRKLSGSVIWNWHLNRGGSYSVSYLTQALAVVKHLQGCYAETVVAGVSQGGAAALLVALQSRPDAAVVAAGHSVLFDEAEWSGHNQLIGVPGYAALFRSAALREAVMATRTRWLFAWGRTDTDVYRVEARRGLTARALTALPNVEVVVHDGGHEAPVEAVRAFVAGRQDGR